AVIAFVADEPLQFGGDKGALKSLFYEGSFMRRGAGNGQGERKTRAVCNCHDLGPFAALSFANASTPFFALAKEPSMNASERSMPPRLCRSSAKMRSTCSQRPACDHSWKRR